MPVYVGDREIEITDVYVGDQLATAVYLGDQLVLPGELGAPLLSDLVVSVGVSSFSLSWTLEGGVPSVYTVRYGTSDAVHDGTTGAVQNVEEASFGPVEGLSEGTYYIRVDASNNEGESFITGTATIAADVTYDFGDWTNDGDIYGGVSSITYGTYGPWFPVEAGPEEATVDQTSHRTVTQTTVNRRQDQTRVCESNSGDTVADALCSSNPSDFSRTLVGETQGIADSSASITPTVDNGGVRERTIDNPAYLPAFTFARIMAEVQSQIGISSSGAITGLGSYFSAFLNGPPNEGANLQFTISLRADSLQPDEDFQDATNSFPGLAAGGSGETRQIGVTVTGSTPYAFRDATDSFTVVGNVSAFQAAPQLSPPEITRVQVRYTNDSGTSVTETLTTSSARGNYPSNTILANANYTLIVTFSSAGALTFSPTALSTSSPASNQGQGNYTGVGLIGRNHIIQIHNSTLDETDTVYLNITGSFSGGSGEEPA